MNDSTSWPSRAEILTTITPWLIAQRWFPGDEMTGTAHIVHYDTLLDDPRVRTLVLELSDEKWIHIPLVLDTGTQDTPGFVNFVVPEGDSNHCADGLILVDGPASPLYLQQWARILEDSDNFAQFSPRDPDLLSQQLHEGAYHAKALDREQSNSSIVYHFDDGSVAAKIFRVLSRGEQPEVDVPMQLAQVGWTHVPTPLGASYLHIDVENADHTTAIQCCTGYLYDYVDPAEDGFDRIVRLAQTGHNGLEDLRELGKTTASMHKHLLKAFGPGDSMSGVLVANRIMEQRDLALEAYPAFGEEEKLLEGIDSMMTTMNELGQLPSTQRVHGDYHLGQCLWTDNGWYILDFEGEPLRPAYERVLPDQPARDIAGLLRSIDYVVATAGESLQWGRKARQAFLHGYFAIEDQDDLSAPELLVIQALEIEKALYEVRYEALHRPNWVHIPLEALRRILIDNIE